MRFLYYILLLVIILGATSLFGQRRKFGKPIVENYTSYEYEAGLQNWAVVQDDRGVIYVGNRFGVLEYDGIRWNLIELQKKTIGRSLAVDSMGRTYVGGQGEFGYLKPDSLGRYDYFPLWEKLPDSYKDFEDVWRIHLTPEVVAFSTTRYLFLFDGQDFEVVKPLKENHLFDRAYFCRDRLYLQEMELGLLAWNNGALELVPGGEMFARDRIKEILPFEQDKYLILTFSEGLFIADQEGIRPWQVPASRYAEENFVYSAVLLRDGSYAVGTADRGLIRFDAAGQIIQTLDRFDGLQNNTVLGLLQDKEDNLWLGLDNGLAYVEINSPFSQISGNVAFQGTPYSSIIWDDNLYLGTTNGVFVSTWNRVFDPLQHTEFNLLPNTQGQAYQLSVVDDELLLAHHNGAFAIRNNRAIRISNTEGAWTFVQLNNYPDYMIGGTYTGLDLFKKGAQGWEFVKHFTGFPESSRNILQDSMGYIWVAHGNKGVFRVTLSDDLEQIEEVRRYGADDGFPSDIFIKVHRLMDQLVFTAEFGSFRFDPLAERFVPHSQLNEIFGPDAYIRALVEDTWGNVWYQVGEEFGVLQITDSGFGKDINRIGLDKLKGKLLAGFEHIRPYSRDGVLIGTQEGFFHFDSGFDLAQRRAFGTLIRSVEIIGRPDELIYGGAQEAGGSPLFEIPADKNSIRVRYAAMFYEDTDNIQYSVRLDGFDRAWSDWGSATEKEYTNIPEGQYIFEVKARNIYQQESESGSIRVSILQPWYKSRIALSLYGVSFVGLIASIFLINNRRMEREKIQIIVEKDKTLKMQEEAHNVQAARSEEQIIRLKNEKLEAEIAYKTRELTSSALHLVQKGEILRKIKSELEKLSPGASDQNRIRKLIKVIDDDLKLDKNWEKFEYHFDSVHENFLKRLRDKFPMLTPKDQRLCAYLRMNLSTKEIAPLMNISVRGVEISRYRLRKKMELDPGVNLVEFLLKIKPNHQES